MKRNLVLLALVLFLVSLVVTTVWLTPARWLRTRSGPSPAAMASYPTAPFSAVDYRSGDLQVRVDDDWYTLVSVEGVAADELVKFARKRFTSIWEKRLSEDLGYVFEEMGRVLPASPTVELRATSGATEVRSILQTGENRWLAREYGDSLWESIFD